MRNGDDDDGVKYHAINGGGGVVVMVVYVVFCTLHKVNAKFHDDRLSSHGITE